MAYIGGLIVAALFFLALHYFTELTTKQKAISGASVLILIMAAIAFNAYNNKQREMMLNAVLKYKQGKTIICSGQKINAKSYSLSIGTYTFIGKKNTPHYAEMIPASSCN